jgi:hypothetical protein
MIKLPQFQPKLSESGRIKNGVNVPVTDKAGKQLYDDRGRPKMRPAQLDHFLITTMQKDPQSGNFIVDEQIMAALKSNPEVVDADGKVRRIPIFVHSDDIEEVFPTRLALYEGKVARCSGNGEKAERWTIQKGARVGQPQEIECPCSYLDDGSCKAHGILRCSIALPSAITLGSVYAYRTTSRIGVPRILGGLCHIQAEIGTLVGIPLWLVLKPELVTPEGQSQKTVYTTYVHLRGADIIKLQQHAIARAQAAKDVQAIAGRRVLLGLSAPADDEEDEVEQDHASEFHPEDLKAGKDFDPKTGEVFDTTASDKPSGPVPASQMKPGDTGYKTEPKPGAERLTPPDTPPPSTRKTDPALPAVDKDGKPVQTELAKHTEMATVGFDDILPKDDPLRVRIATELTNLAELRGADSNSMAQLRKELLAEATKETCGEAVPFGKLKLGHGMKVVDRLTKLIEAEQRKLIAEGESDDEEIP